MTPLPLTVISGYLGAGKTSLINTLLAEPHGLRLMVMVNDFGAVNIDASLIAAQDDDVIALTNGCVCCTMGADLFMAIGDALDRTPRPDYLIIEASGIADPKAIATTAIAEPDLRYAGIVTLVDGLNIAALLCDELVAPQVIRQIAVADLVVLTKQNHLPPETERLLKDRGLPIPDPLNASAVGVLALGLELKTSDTAAFVHPDYVSWSWHAEHPLDHDGVMSTLGTRPKGLYRLKGFVPTDRGQLAVHAVGAHLDTKLQDGIAPGALVGIGASARLKRETMDEWWASATSSRAP